MAASTGLRLQDALAKLNYVPLMESSRAMAEHGGFDFADLTAIEIPKAVTELVPESVARENVVMPLYNRDQGGSFGEQGVQSGALRFRLGMGDGLTGQEARKFLVSLPERQ